MIKIMTRIVIAMILLTAYSSIAFAQKKTSNAHIGIVYPISTNGLDAFDYSNKFSLHLFAGVSGAEEAFCASGFANVIKKDGNGFIGAGFANVILDGGKGAHLAGFANYIKGDVSGLQAAGYVNVIGSATGVQAAGFTNVNLKYMRGLQAAGFANIAKEVTGFQAAGYVNVAKNVRGAQASGFVNVAKDVKGVQVAGYVNVSGNVNTQIAGFVNVAKEVKGVQISGFINIADSSAFPIGLINIIKKGEKCIGITADDNLTTLLTFRSGGKYLYGIVGAGSNFSYADPIFALESGLGAHIPIAKNFRINTEVTITSLTDFWDEFEVGTSFRVLPAVKLGNTIELFAGPTFNYLYSDHNTLLNDKRKNTLWSSNKYGYYNALYIGALAGIQIHI